MAHASPVLETVQYSHTVSPNRCYRRCHVRTSAAGLPETRLAGEHLGDIADARGGGIGGLQDLMPWPYETPKEPRVSDSLHRLAFELRCDANRIESVAMGFDLDLKAVLTDLCGRCAVLALAIQTLESSDGE